MRYERLELDLTTAACDYLKRAIENQIDRDAPLLVDSVIMELVNVTNELEARLQRKDPDPKSALNVEINPEAKGWLDV